MSRKDYGERSSTTNPEFRDQTRTPAWLFKALDQEFHFQLDVAALPETALCQQYLTPTINALAVNWGDFLSPVKRAPWVWCNPPYSDIGPWLEKALIEQMNGIGTVFLIPLDKSAKWYEKTKPNEIREIVGGRTTAGKWVPGRVPFICAETGKELKGNPKGSMILVFAPGYPRGPKTISEIRITDLMAHGGYWDGVL